MIEVCDLTFSYPRGPQVLKGITFGVESGSLCGLFGPNGSGKTTLFRCMMRFLDYHHGSIIVDGSDLKKLKIRSLARLIAYVPQEHKVTFPFPVRDVILMGRTPHLRSPFGASREDKLAAMRAMNTVGIEDLALKRYNELSGGQRQLVIIARALAQDPKLLLLDEPTSALDFSNQIKVWKLLEEIAAGGSTVIACTHDPNHVAWFCDEAVVLGDNRLVAAGKAADVINAVVLQELYGDLCEVAEFGPGKFVYPDGLAGDG